jgi:hypothetical protein
MIRGISGFGPGYKPPGYHALRTNLLRKAKAKVDRGLDLWRDLGEEWTGFVLASDGFEDVARNPLINIVLSTPKGAHFVEAVNATGQCAFRSHAHA